MWVYIVPGGLSVFVAALLFLGAGSLLWAFLLGSFLDMIYLKYGVIICTSFIVTSIVYFLQQLIQKPREATILCYFLNYIVAPLFVLYLIAAYLYATPSSELLAAPILMLLLIIFLPVIALIGGIIFTSIITIIARMIPIKFNVNHNTQD